VFLSLRRWRDGRGLRGAALHAAVARRILRTGLVPVEADMSVCGRRRDAWWGNRLLGVGNEFAFDVGCGRAMSGFIGVLRLGRTAGFCRSVDFIAIVQATLACFFGSLRAIVRQRLVIFLGLLRAVLGARLRGGSLAQQLLRVTGNFCEAGARVLRVEHAGEQVMLTARALRKR
jgi:hypothetical protein